MDTITEIPAQDHPNDEAAFRAYMEENTRRRKLVKSKFVRRAKRTPLHLALLNAFSKWNYGVTDANGRRYAYKPATVAARYNMGDWSKSLSAADLENHWLDNHTLYYMSNGDPRQDRVLIMLDFDAKNGVGSYEGCLKAEQYISNKYFQGNVFAEDSTHGNGRHAYIWIHKLGRTAEEVNAAINHLQDVIRTDLNSVNADISGFDIQGTCPVIRWEKFHGKLRMESFVNGRLAKIPRTATPELLNAAEITLDDIYQFKSVPVPAIPESPSPRRVQSVGYGMFMDEEHFAHLDRQRKLYQRLICRFNHGECVKAKQRYIVREDHAAIAFAILKFVFEHPHKDGTFPQQRAQSLWEDAYRRGFIDASWNHHRWIALRNFLSQQGFIDWEDNSYFHHFGETQKGRACKWTVTVGFYEMLSEVLDSSSLSQGGDLGIQALHRGTGQALIPVFFDPQVSRIHPNVLLRASKLETFTFAA